MGRPAIAVKVWAPQDATKPCPMIVYVPSWGGRRDENQVMLAELAHNGFIVAAADDVSHDPPDPAVDAADEAVRKAPFRAFSAEDLAAFPDVSARRTKLGFEKLDRVVEALMRLPADALPATIDASRIGVVGFSFGGAVAATALARDPRIAAAINLDGWLIHTAAAPGVSRPLLALYAMPDFNPRRFWTSTANFFVTKLTLEDLRAALSLQRTSQIEVFLIAGVQHGDFSDAVYSADRWRRWRPWRTDVIRSERMREIVTAFVTPFLQQHVAGRATLGQRPSFIEVAPLEAFEARLQ
ncbi:dienelactone hydrolase [Rhodoblastus acidophilus]|uniref:dienelactone hydrolase family protein n=1 Tax=Rhodoblastus acidophilus TaxID=1074 RepID=UPI0022247523|nr:dienelactone hydrolase family protein [Rhodoblastus acidophilus]MCW2283817.1 dienelactone hydrolase [Rhodoblastus acidophilus]MCW2332834.1 dienelactone hydrolase [Rhodoblastus acidophilus]